MQKPRKPDELGLRKKNLDLAKIQQNPAGWAFLNPNFFATLVVGSTGYC